MRNCLVDTSVWIDHLRHGEDLLKALLEADLVLIHPFVIGELACGNLADRDTTLALFEALPTAPKADHHEVLAMINACGLPGLGLGWIDVHLLASARLAASALWTKDRRMAKAASAIGLGTPEQG